jgi:hypothetical protein
VAKRAYRLHPITWVVTLGVFAVFVWLNFNSSRQQYLEKHGESWRGGLRHGFPIAWWDAGIDTRGVLQNGVLYLDSKPYGGWRAGGICCGLAALFASLAVSAAGCERIIRALRPSARSSDLSEMDRRANRAVPIRPVTAFVAVALLAGLTTANLTLRTEPRDEQNAAAGFTQSMGWPAMTFLASEPYLRGMETAGRPAVEIVHYLENHPQTYWTYTHWHSMGIVLNVICCTLLVMAVACACEWVLRHEASVHRLALEHTTPQAKEKFS